jgi:hypothetical protein
MEGVAMMPNDSSVSLSIDAEGPATDGDYLPLQPDGATVRVLHISALEAL